MTTAPMRQLAPSDDDHDASGSEEPGTVFRRVCIKDLANDLSGVEGNEDSD